MGYPKQKTFLGKNVPIGGAAKSLLDDESGSTLVFSALALTVLLAMTGLGIEGAMWLTSKRQMQSVADAGVISAVTVLAKSGGTVAAKQAAVENAALNGFADGSDGQVTVNVPPQFGPNAGRSGYVEVILDRPVPASLASLFHDGAVNVQARAVGGVVTAGSNCVLALDPALDAAVELKGSPDIELSCGIASNSSSDHAILIKGDAAVVASSLQAYGQIAVETNGYVNTAGPVQPLSERLADPFKNIEIPLSDPGCGDAPISYGNENVTLTPGLYCGGFKFNGTAVTLEPGVYVIDSGPLSTKGTTTLTGTDVTIVFTSADSQKIGGPSLAGGTIADLFAPGPEGHFPYDPMHPDHGAYAGMLFIQDPAAPALARNDLTGGSAMNFGGALYFPNQEVVYSGGSAEADACMQIVARKVTFAGSAVVNYDPLTCQEQGVDHMSQTRVRLVE
jgi:hypothetical protein